MDWFQYPFCWLWLFLLYFCSLQDLYRHSVSWIIPSCLLQYVSISSSGFWAGEDHGICTTFVHDTVIGSEQCCFPSFYRSVGSTQPVSSLLLSNDWVCHRLLRRSLFYDCHRDKFEWCSIQKVGLCVNLFRYISSVCFWILLIFPSFLQCVWTLQCAH